MTHPPHIQKHTIVLPFQAGSFKRRLTVRVMTLGRPDTVFFAGFGNEAPALRHTVRLLEAKGVTDIAVVCAMPYWEAQDSIDSMIALGVAGNIAVLEYLQKLTRRKRLHVISESQAAAALVHAAVSRPELFTGRSALLRPLGLVQIRKRQFVGRMTRGALQRDQLLDWRVLSVGQRAAWRTLQTVARRGVPLTVALAWDIREHLGQVHQAMGKRLCIFAAAQDLLYPPAAIRVALSELKHPPDLKVIAGSHSSPATHAGVRQIEWVLAWCRNSRSPAKIALEESPN